MLANPAQGFLTVSVQQVVTQRFQGKVHDVVVVQFERRDLRTDLEPDAVQEIDFDGCEAGSVWSQASGKVP